MDVANDADGLLYLFQVRLLGEALESRREEANDLRFCKGTLS